MKFTIKQGMNQETLKQYPDNHFDSIVTDPPYGIEFLGKDWDSNTGAVETWEECYRVLKPGGHMLAFSAARTYHKLATNIESVGFEIRDQLMWLYASGFPKAQDIGKAIDKRAGKQHKKPDIERYEGSNEVIDGSFGSGHGKCSLCKKDIVEARILASKQQCTVEGCEWMEQYKPADNEWAGWKTALKPAHEPIVMARKPFKGSAVDNVLKHGTGALNIDATRIETVGEKEKNWTPQRQSAQSEIYLGGAKPGDSQSMYNEAGRFPSNVLGEIPDYQKYFYCPKVSRAERHIGFEKKPEYFIQRPRDENGNTTSETGPQILRERDKANLDHIPNRHPGADGGGYQVHNVNHKEITLKDKKANLDHIPTGNNIGDGVYAPGTPGNKNNAVGKTSTGMFDKNGNVQTMVYDPATHNVGNNHPTVKPVALMSYLVKLVTPEGGKVLDPFNGSGSTGMACVQHGFDYTGCELDPNYVEIATKRIEGWYKHIQPDNNYNELFKDIK